MFDEKGEHVVVLVRMVFHFVDDDYYDWAVVYTKNEEEEEEELVDDEVKQQVVIQVYTVDDQKDGKYYEVVSLVAVVVVYDDDIDYNGYLYYWFHVGVQNEFVALLVNVDQMIEEEKKCYQYMMYEAKELVVLVHVDDLYKVDKDDD
jgi:hypothetical protein